MMKKKRMRAPAGAVPEVAKKLAEPEEVPEEEEEEVEEGTEHAEDGEADESEDHGHPPAMEGPPIINDTDGLISRYEDIVLGSGRTLPWLERLEIITPEPISVTSANDDLAREAAFYAQAMQSVDRAIDAFNDQGFVWRRPDDFFAEMLKTDEHMQKVRAKLLSEKTELEATVEKRKQREIKKYGKEVQRKRTEEKQQSKKVQLDAVKKWRQDRKLSGGGAGGEDFDVGILDEAENNVSKKRKAAPSPNQSRKRQAKDEKFGFGGKKRGSKRNTAESTADFGRGATRGRGGSRGGRGGRGGGRGGRGGGGGAGGKRPGKSARQGRG